MNRRYFIRQSGLLLAAANLSLPAFARAPKSLPLGVQLFSIRNYLNKDFDGTIAKVAEIGYKYVESAGYNRQQHTIHGQSPKVFREKLLANHIEPVSAHANFSLAEADASLEDFATVGVKYLVCPSARGEYRKTAQGYYQLAEELNAIGKKAKEKGIQFGYHNHDFEFKQVENELPYDILLKNTDPEYVFFQPDLGWMIKAGYDPIDYFKKHSGRFPLWHLRDINESGAPVSAGSGKVDFKNIFANRKLAGYKLGIVETPTSQTEGISHIEKSIQFLGANKLY